MMLQMTTKVQKSRHVEDQQLAPCLGQQQGERWGSRLRSIDSPYNSRISWQIKEDFMELVEILPSAWYASGLVVFQ